MVNLFPRFQNGAPVTKEFRLPPVRPAPRHGHSGSEGPAARSTHQGNPRIPHRDRWFRKSVRSPSKKLLIFSAATIFGRVKALGSNGRAPSPQEMLKLRKPALRKAGLSGAKILAMKDLAKKTIEGIVPSLEEANKLSDEELVKRLVSVRGIGAWTVEMFLIFRLGRPDVLPIHDLGVRKGWSVTYGKKHMPKPKELLAFGERWRPYRTVASWYMWRACQRAGHAALRKIRPAKVRRKREAARAARTRPRPRRS
ncbi:MAG: DNA-3-methyladenine glycosylase 2 family protein [Acidobacteria bacterium]|nr:MAG: DNA-3-methyladenine glycosylase 2 family protein [Acidobacteriota bacterium]